MVGFSHFTGHRNDPENYIPRPPEFGQNPIPDILQPPVDITSQSPHSHAPMQQIPHGANV